MLSLRNKLSCAIFSHLLHSSLLECCANVRVSNSLDWDEMQSYSVSHRDPSCLHMDFGSDWRAKG